MQLININLLHICCIYTAFEDYLYQGGFPELFQIKNKKGYIRNLFNSIILRDIKQRFSIRYPEAIQKMAYYLTENE